MSTQRHIKDNIIMSTQAYKGEHNNVHSGIQSILMLTQVFKGHVNVHYFPWPVHTLKCEVDSVAPGGISFPSLQDRGKKNSLGVTILTLHGVQISLISPSPQTVGAL